MPGGKAAPLAYIPRMADPTTASNANSNVESLLKEDRIFAPSAAQAAGLGGAWCASMDEYRARHARSIADPEGFWGEDQHLPQRA